tara:strand:+ start:367 stop:609 length:243 start_codon:yes stop_codon:yes gene_type:complete
MRTSKINQLNKSLTRILDLNTELRNAKFNNGTDKQIEKIEDREEKACNRAYEICKTMTEQEYDATDFQYIMCMDYETAIS